MSKQQIAAQLNGLIAHGSVIRANDPLWTRPVSSVTVENEKFVAIDIYGTSFVADRFFDASGSPLFLER